MLTELRLRNLAIAADVTLELAPGLNVLTGSTGAGKSLVVEALRWLAGERVDRTIVRAGEEQASAEAIFDLTGRPDLVSRLGDLGVDLGEDHMLRLRREVRAGGRSRAFLEARVSTAGLLAACCHHLIELQSQHQQLELLDPRHHASVLDACGVEAALRSTYRQRHRDLQACTRAAREWRQRQEQLRDQRELLHFQLRELEQARLEGDEMDALRQRVAILAGGARLMEGAAAAQEALAEETSGAVTALQRALRGLQAAGREIPALEEARESLAAAADLTAEALRSLETFLAEEDFDPQALESCHARLAELEGLCRKYARTESELVLLRDRLSREVAELDLGDALPGHLAEPLDTARAALEATAKQLRRARKRVARRAENEAAALLTQLAMPGASVRFDLNLRTDPAGEIRLEGRRVDAGPRGPEDVVLQVRTNPGEAFERIDRIASGGELSRLGLVLRTLSLPDRPPAILILDEVDTGLGADTGPALAARLTAMAEHTQLLVITHLPAVAAAADRHLLAAKGPSGGRTISRVDRLDSEGRLTELARMLGGEGEGPRRLAAELLEQRGRWDAAKEHAG